MKQLSKITFINSAHIRFGAVELDGNVHFTGTQGVGKSTLLRAILFSTMPTSSTLAYACRGKSLSTISTCQTPTLI